MDMYKLFFGSQAMCPDSSEDAGLSCNRPDTQVSSPVPGLAIRIFIMDLPFNQLSLWTGVDSASKIDTVSGPPP